MITCRIILPKTDYLPRNLNKNYNRRMANKVIGRQNYVQGL